MPAIWQSVKNCWIILSVLFKFTDKRQKKWLNELILSNLIPNKNYHEYLTFDWLIDVIRLKKKKPSPMVLCFLKTWTIAYFVKSSCFNPNVLYIEIIYVLPIQGPFRKGNFFFFILLKQYYGVLRGQKYSKWLCFVFQLLDCLDYKFPILSLGYIPRSLRILESIPQYNDKFSARRTVLPINTSELGKY